MNPSHKAKRGLFNQSVVKEERMQNDGCSGQMTVKSNGEAPRTKVGIGKAVDGNL